MKARTLAVARGEYRVADEPKVWFTSTESFAKVLSAGNRELLRIISESAPGSIEELAQLTGRAKSNLSRTLKTMGKRVPHTHGLSSRASVKMASS
jgi:predicted transcriptional regulator